MVMSLIESLTRIKNAVYGREVREAIHDGVFRANQIADGADAKADQTQIRQDNLEAYNDQMIQEMTDKDVISAPELIDARKGEAKLSARLDKEYNEVTAQLAQTTAQSAQTSAEIKTQWVNVLYPPEPLVGLSGDGTNNDTVKLQTIINHFENQHVTLFFPNNHTYMIDGVETKREQIINFKGEGLSSIIKQNSGIENRPIIKHNYLGRLVVEDLKIEGNVLNAVRNSFGIEAFGSIDIKNVMLENISGRAIHCHHSTIMENVRVSRCRGGGIYVSFDSVLTNIRIGTVWADALILSGNHNTVNGLYVWMAGDSVHDRPSYNYLASGMNVQGFGNTITGFIISSSFYHGIKLSGRSHSLTGVTNMNGCKEEYNTDRAGVYANPNFRNCVLNITASNNPERDSETGDNPFDEYGKQKYGLLIDSDINVRGNVINLVSQGVDSVLKNGPYNQPVYYLSLRNKVNITGTNVDNSVPTEVFTGLPTPNIESLGKIIIFDNGLGVGLKPYICSQDNTSYVWKRIGD